MRFAIEIQVPDGATSKVATEMPTTYRLIWTRHALNQLGKRTALETDDVLRYFVEGAAVQSRAEENGVKEFVIFSPLDRECFAIVLARDLQVITIMPIKWRKVAPGFIDQARKLQREKIEEAA